MSALPNCDCCGRFTGSDQGASWAMRFSGYPPTPDHEAFRCVKCTTEYGPIPHDSRTRPEMTSGMF